MDDNRIPHIAARAGQILLENGGETYRVEETILRICDAYGLHECDSFVTPTGFMLSVTFNDKTTSSIVRRIKKRTVDLEKVAKINALSRALVTEKYPVLFLEQELDKINNLKRNTPKTTLLFSALAAGVFTLLFGGGINDFLSSLLIGAFIKHVSNKLSTINMNEFFINISGGFIAAALSIASTKLGMASSTDKVIIGSIMILVPGLTITNAIRDTLAGDLVSGITRALEAFIIAVGIAVGTGIVYKIWFAITGGITV